MADRLIGDGRSDERDEVEEEIAESVGCRCTVFDPDLLCVPDLWFPEKTSSSSLSWWMFEFPESARDRLGPDSAGSTLSLSSLLL